MRDGVLYMAVWQVELSIVEENKKIDDDILQEVLSFVCNNYYLW